MITVNCSKNKYIISGHANFADYGCDIVCASVSSICYTTINAILNIDNNAIKVVDEKNLVIEILKDDKIINILIDNMITLLTELAAQYPKNIKICKGE